MSGHDRNRPNLGTDDPQEREHPGLWYGSYDSMGSVMLSRPMDRRGDEDDRGYYVTDPAKPGTPDAGSDFRTATDVGEATTASVVPTPLPWKKLAIIAYIFFCNFFSTTCLFPFMAFMIRDFGVAKNDGEIGYYVGALASTFNLGQFLSGYFWGSLSDRIGRRPTILIAFAGASVTIVAFGFSPSYAFAVGCRLLLGLVNGTVGVARSCIREVTDETNQAKGFSLIGLTWGVALIAGPASTGLLADPTQLTDEFRGTIFDKYPYSLPCIVAGVINISGFIVTYYFLEETASKAKGKGRSEPLLHNPPTDSDLEKTTKPPVKRWWQKGSTFRYLWADSIVRNVCLLYAFKALIYIVYDEIFPLWALNDKDKGGMGFVQRDVGVTLAAGGASLIIFQTMIYPRIAGKVGLKTAFMLGTLSLCPIFMFTPMLELTNDSKPAVMWTIVLVAMVLRSVLGWQTMTSMLVMISNAAPGDMGGAAAGLSQSLVSLARTIGPPVFGILFAWSASNHKDFPLDYHFVFLLLGIANLILLVLVGLIPAARVERRIEATVTDYKSVSLKDPTEVERSTKTVN